METTASPGHIVEDKYRRYYPAILGATIVAVVILAIYVSVALDVDVVYTHLFYIPIILAAILYHRKAVYLALFFGVLHIALDYLPSGPWTYEPFLRAIMFVIIAYIVGTVAARKDELYGVLKASEDSLRRMRDTLEQQVRERTQELSDTNESLKKEITERKQAEKALVKSRAILSRAQKIAHVGNWAWNLQTNTMSWSDEIYKIFGYGPDDVKPCYDWLTSRVVPEDRPLIAASLDAALREGRLFNIDYRIVAADGTVRYVNTVADRIKKDKAGNPEFMYGISQDITPRKEVEKALVKSKAILSRAQKIAHVGNWAWDLKTGRMQWSDELYRIFGYDPGDAQPSYHWLLSRVAPGDRPSVAASLDGALHGDRLFNIDFSIAMPDGSRRCINMVADRIKKDKAGNPEFMYGIIQDITTRKLTEAALQDAKAEAELYLDLMSHDINNLNQIGIGFLEMALDRPQEMSAGVREMLAKPLEALESSSRLIKNVGKLQRAREGELRVEKTSVGEVIRGLLPKYSGAAGRDVRIDYHGGDCHVMANELLTDVFSNIIGNAIKHSEGPLVVDIDVTTVQEDGRDYCAVSVADNGPGIPDSLKQKLFVRFQRGTAKTSGRGLGLYLVKTLVDDYCGKVWVEDRVPGDHTKGAKFIVMLPTAQ